MIKLTEPVYLKSAVGGSAYAFSFLFGRAGCSGGAD